MLLLALGSRDLFDFFVRLLVFDERNQGNLVNNFRLRRNYYTDNFIMILFVLKKP